MHAAAWGDTHLFHEGYALERTIVPFSHSVSPLPTLMSVVKTSADDLEFPIIYPSNLEFPIIPIPIWNFTTNTNATRLTAARPWWGKRVRRREEENGACHTSWVASCGKGFPCFVAAPRLRARCRTLPDPQTTINSRPVLHGWTAVAPGCADVACAVCALMHGTRAWHRVGSSAVSSFAAASVQLSATYRGISRTSPLFHATVRQAQCAPSLTKGSFSVR